MRIRGTYSIQGYFVGASLLLPALLSGADVWYTNAGGGTWETATNWSTGAIPGVNDRANIAFNTLGTPVVYSALSALNTVDSIQIGGFVGGGFGGSGQLDITGGLLTVAPGAQAGGGVVLAITNNNTLPAELNMTGGLLMVSGGNFETALNGYGVANFGPGATYLQQSNNVIVGQGATSIATFNNDGATIVVTGGFRVANRGVGQFNQTSGSTIVSGLFDLANVNNAAGDATANVSGGIVTVGTNLTIGNSDNAASDAQFNLTGGTVTVSGEVQVAEQGSNSSGELHVSGGTLIAGGDFSVGMNGAGAINTPSIPNPAAVGTLVAPPTLTPAGSTGGFATISGTGVVVANNTFVGENAGSIGKLSVQPGGTLVTNVATNIGMAGEGWALFDGTVTSPVVNVNPAPNAGGVLQGSGVLAASAGAGLIVHDGGIFEPGTTDTGLAMGVSEVGTFTLDGDADLRTGSTTNIQLAAPLGDINPDNVSPADFLADVTAAIAGDPDPVNAITGEHDAFELSGGLTLNAGGIIDVTDLGVGFAKGQYFDILDFGSLTNNGFTGALGDGAGDPRFRSGSQSALYDLKLPDLPTISGSSELRWDTSLFFTDGVIFIVPEPSRALLCAIGFGALFLRRRR